MKQPVRKKVIEANGINPTKQIYSLLVDGNNLLKISLVNKELNNDGKEYGGVLNFIRMLGNILLKKDFDYCSVCWDGENSGIMRYQYYKDYKANRDKHYENPGGLPEEYLKKYKEYSRKVIEYSRSKRGENVEETEDEAFKRQKKIIQMILEELCIRQYEYESVEGDDIISYIVKNRKDNEKVVIVSSDKDLTQLISTNVIIYNPRMKDFVTKDNSVKMLGITHENIVLEKIICGDVSDNIKGIKGVGEQTLVKLFPEIKTDKTNLEAIIRRSKELLEERKANKKKPLKSLENIVNGITDGCQGGDIYEINRKIIDLSEPLLTEEAREELSDDIHLAIDTDDRDLKNVYRIIDKYKMDDIKDEEKFGNLFASYSRIIMMEQKRFTSYKEKNS
jgi:5'-3' exonuclease